MLACVRACVHVCLHVCVCLYVVCVCVVCVCVHACVCVCACMCVHAFACVCARAYMYACVWMVQMNERKTAVQNKPQVRTIQTTRIFHTHTESKQNSEMKTYPFCVREGWWWEWAGPVCQAVWGRVYWERHRGSMPRPLGLGDPEHVFVGLIRCSLGVCDLVL